MLRMAYQVLRKYIQCQTYIDKDAWKVLDFYFESELENIQDDVKQEESIKKLLDFITAARENIQFKISLNEFNEEKLTWFDKKLQPVISTLQSTLSDKRLSLDKYLSDDMFFHFITNKNITYALFSNITRLDDYTTEYGKIFATIPDNEWLFLRWFSRQDVVYNNIGEDNSYTYEQITTILTCGNNIQHHGVHYNWAGDFVDAFSSNFTTKAIEDFHICLSKLLCKMVNISDVISNKNSIETMVLEDDILNVLNSKLKPEIIVLNTLQNSSKDEETQHSTSKFLKSIENIHQTSKIIAEEKAVIAKEKDIIKQELEFDMYVKKTNQEKEAARLEKEENRIKRLKAKQEYLKEIEELREIVRILEAKLKSTRTSKRNLKK